MKPVPTPRMFTPEIKSKVDEIRKSIEAIQEQVRIDSNILKSLDESLSNIVRSAECIEYWSAVTKRRNSVDYESFKEWFNE